MKRAGRWAQCAGVIVALGAATLVVAGCSSTVRGSGLGSSSESGKSSEAAKSSEAGTWARRSLPSRITDFSGVSCPVATRCMVTGR